MSHPHRRPTTDPNAEAAEQLAALGREPIPAEERKHITALVRKAIRSGVYRVTRPANDVGER